MPQLTVRFEDLAVGDEAFSVSRVVTRDDVKRYADASGDQNPLHQDEDFARAVGFPGIIAHGMFTMGHLARSLTDWLGDPSRLKRLSVQFRAPVFMGETIVAEGRVKALDPSDPDRGAGRVGHASSGTGPPSTPSGGARQWWASRIPRG